MIGMYPILLMHSLFQGKRDFNDDISLWNVSNVSNMNGMFDSALSFNQDLGKWDVSNVTDHQDMFKKAKSFDISNSPHFTT